MASFIITQTRRFQVNSVSFEKAFKKWEKDPDKCETGPPEIEIVNEDTGMEKRYD